MHNTTYNFAPQVVVGLNTAAVLKSYASGFWENLLKLKEKLQYLPQWTEAVYLIPQADSRLRAIRSRCWAADFPTETEIGIHVAASTIMEKENFLQTRDLELEETWQEAEYHIFKVYSNYMTLENS